LLNCRLNQIAETVKSLDVTEKGLYRTWLSQAFNQTNLRTVDGRSLSIISPGKRNDLEGPDFHDALIMLDGEFKRGAIEMHLEANDWYRHGHDHDPLYEQVILHVIRNAAGLVAVKTSQNATVPMLVLDLSDATDYVALRCSSWPNVDYAGFNQVMQEFAERRLQRKALLIQSEILRSGAEQIFYEGLADVLGYSRNREAFRSLARWLPLSKLWQIIADSEPDERLIRIESLLFGGAGFFYVDKQKFIISDSQYVAGLRDYWAELAARFALSPCLHLTWHFAGSRPANSPIRRLAALAQILFKIFPDWPGQRWCTMLTTIPDYERLYQIISDLFQQPEGLWRNHLLLKGQPGKVLMGKSRLHDLLINHLLPFGFSVAILEKNHSLIERIKKHYLRVATGEIPGIVAGILTKIKMPKNRLEYNFQIQGLIELYHRFCELNLCNLCPLEKYAH